MQPKRIVTILSTLVLVFGLNGIARAQEPTPDDALASAGTAFTYQGQLTQGGSAVTGSCDFQFSLWDAETIGTQIGPTVTKSGVTVTNGLFTVQLDFGANAFTGQARWLEIGVKCAGDSGYTTLTPRQALTPAPYALYAPAAGNAATVTNGVYTSGSYANPAWLTSLAGGKISSPVANATSATNFSGPLSGDVTGTQGATSVVALRGVGILSTAPVNGQVLQYNGSKWGPASALASLWSLTGNSGTNPLTNFLGTLDNVALELRVNNLRALRLEPNATSPNIIGGYSGNWVKAGVVGAVIGGGGATGILNQVTDNYGVVGGGTNNQAGDNYGTTSDHVYATIGGGADNFAIGGYATIGGGTANQANGNFSTVGGGNNNVSSGPGAFVGGGGYDGAHYYGNAAAANAATICGGLSNQVTYLADYGTVGGGAYNGASGYVSTVSGGYSNAASGDYASVGGGNTNAASNWYSTVGGGNTNTASGQVATVSGGVENTASGTSATVGGGWGNTASGVGAFIGGGGDDGTTSSGNTAAAKASIIGGGLGNQVNAGADYSTIGGGAYNTANGNLDTVGGGDGNNASGGAATVSGGWRNTATGDFTTVAGGMDAAATHYGETAHASGLFGTAGDAQASEYVMRNTTTDAVQTELFLDGYSSRITLDSGRTLSFDILIVAHSSTGGSSAGYQIKGLIESVAGTTAFVGTPTVTVLGEDVPAWDAAVTADDTNEALVIKVTGAASTNIRWVASVRTVEVGW